MAIIGYAAALEQFHPTELLEYCGSRRITASKG